MCHSGEAARGFGKYGLESASESGEVVVYDEIHKYSRWKQFLKGFYDLYGKRVRIVATGSAKMDVYKKGATHISESLRFFQEKLGAKHAFQVVVDTEYGDYDCFSMSSPTVVSARTFLSQLF